MRARAPFLAAILLAGAFRFPHLASRPMHADEAVNAAKLGILLEGGGYQYDPTEYHGPTLYYLTLLSAWLHGARRYVDVDEVVLRSVPAALGVALVAAHLAARRFLGTGGATVAAALAAISPAMVFYSRYYIHETALVLFSFGALLAVCRYQGAPSAAPALMAGACAGLMMATKETAPLALASMLLAFVLTRDPGRRLVSGRHLALALLAAAIVSGAFFTSFLSQPGGLVDAVRAYGFYLGRAQGASWHVHPWSYYLRLLIHSPASGAPFWSEGLILVLASIGGAAGWLARDLPGTHSRALRFVAFYTVLMLVTYSSIPYKTPWCLLGFLHGMVLLAGPGAVFLARSLPGAATRAVVGVLLVSAAAHLGWQAFVASYPRAADPRNPYVYAHTSTDVFEIVGRVKGLARAHPDGSLLPVQVLSHENLWPLPYYLRGLPRVGWWKDLPDSEANAPVILVTPDMEPALTRRLYDLPPAGERELYVDVFQRRLELRPGVEVRGYATSRLWDSYRRLEADRGQHTPGVVE